MPGYRLGFSSKLLGEEASSRNTGASWVYITFWALDPDWECVDTGRWWGSQLGQEKSWLEDYKQNTVPAGKSRTAVCFLHSCCRLSSCFSLVKSLHFLTPHLQFWWQALDDNLRVFGSSLSKSVCLIHSTSEISSLSPSFISAATVLVKYTFAFYLDYHCLFTAAPASNLVPASPSIWIPEWLSLTSDNSPSYHSRPLYPVSCCLSCHSFYSSHTNHTNPPAVSDWLSSLLGLCMLSPLPAIYFPSFSTSTLSWCFKAQLKCYLLCESIPGQFPKRYSCLLPFGQCSHCFCNGLSRLWAHLKGLIIHLSLSPKSTGG